MSKRKKNRDYEFEEDSRKGDEEQSPIQTAASSRPQTQTAALSSRPQTRPPGQQPTQPPNELPFEMIATLKERSPTLTFEHPSLGTDQIVQVGTSLTVFIEYSICIRCNKLLSWMPRFNKYFPRLYIKKRATNYHLILLGWIKY